MVANNCISLSGIVKSDLSFGLEGCAVHEIDLEFIFCGFFTPTWSTQKIKSPWYKSSGLLFFIIFPNCNRQKRQLSILKDLEENLELWTGFRWLWSYTSKRKRIFFFKTSKRDLVWFKIDCYMWKVTEAESHCWEAGARRFKKFFK